MKTVNPTVAANRRYLVRFSIAIVAYVAVLVAAISTVNHIHPEGVLRYALLLTPLVPVAFMVPAMLAYVRETDEFERRILTDSLAIAAGITAVLSVTYGFLEIAGLPHLSAWWTWIVLMGSWGVARIALARAYQ